MAPPNAKDGHELRSQGPRSIASISLSLLMLTSLFVIIGNSNYAEAEQTPVNLATSNAASSTNSGEVIAASGFNRFVVWFDYTPGNSDIMFKRSTDNGLTWQPTVNLSNNPGSSFSPEIAVSGSNVYVVWTQASSDESQADIFTRRSTDNGATWGSKIKISSSGGNLGLTSRVAASGSNVYIVWYDGSLGDILFRRSTDSGATWKLQVNLSNNAGFSVNPQIAVSGSNVYVVWQDATPGNPDIFLRRSTDSGATWKSIKNLSNNAGESVAPQVAVSGSNVHIVWTDLTPGNTDIFFERSTDSGATWQPTVNLSNNPGESRNPQIAVSGSNVYIVWTQFSSSGECQPADIFFRRSTDNGATWGSKIKISSSGTNFGSLCTGSLPQVAASGSNIYITWEDAGSGSSDVFLRRSTDNGAMWKSIKNLSNNAGDSLVPQVAVSGSNVFVVWQDDTPGNIDIMSRRSTDNGATWKAVKNLSNNAGNSFLPQIAV